MVMAKRAQERKYMGFLPPEILRQIIDYIAEPDILVKGRIKFNYTFDYKVEPQPEKRLAERDIQNLRLVNRQWHDAASVSLLPILKIRLNEESLASAEGLSKSPKIAAGIKAVQLVLGYYPGVLIADRQKLYSVMCTRLRNLAETCQQRHFALKYTDADTPTVYQEPYPLALYEREGANAVYTKLDAVATQAMQPEENRTPEQIKADQVKLLLHRAKMKCRRMTALTVQKLRHQPDDSERHDEQDTRLVDMAIEQFHQRYYDQQDLLRTTRFATSVASIMKRMRQDVLLCYSDADEDVQEDRFDTTTATNILDDDALVTMLSVPLVWNRGDVRNPRRGPNGIEQVDNIGLSSVALFCDIPVAMAQAGCKLRRIQMHSWPMHRGAQLLQPEKCPLTTSWQQLTEALDMLEMVYFRPVVKPFSDENRPVTTNQRDTMIEYLRACISAPTLVDISIKCEEMRPFVSNDVYELDVQDLFSGIQSRCLARFSLNNVLTKVEALERAIYLLDESAGKRRLRSVHFLDGSW